MARIIAHGAHPAQQRGSDWASDGADARAAPSGLLGLEQAELFDRDLFAREDLLRVPHGAPMPKGEF